MHETDFDSFVRFFGKHEIDFNVLKSEGGNIIRTMCGPAGSEGVYSPFSDYVFDSEGVFVGWDIRTDEEPSKSLLATLS